MTWLQFSDCALGYFAIHFISIILQDLLGLLQTFLFRQLLVKPGQYYLVHFAVTILYFKAFLYCLFCSFCLGNLLREVYLLYDWEQLFQEYLSDRTRCFETEHRKAKGQIM